MANLLTSSPARAEEAPIQDMEFFLFLADSIVKEGEIVTPVDLQDIEISAQEKQTSTTNNEEEAQND